MKKQQVYILIGIGIILIGGVVLVWQKRANQELPQTQNQEQEQNEQQKNEQKESEQYAIDISDWKIYQDKKYGFEIKYPKDWEIREVKIGPAIGGDYLEVIVDKSRNDIGMGINRFKTNQNPKTWMEEKGWGKIDKEYQIDGYTIFYSKIDNPRVYLLHQYLIYYKNKLIFFDFQEKSRDFDWKTGEIIEEVSFFQYLPAFEAMVRSIKFVD